MMIKLFAYDELNEVICLENSKILAMENISREEKTVFAEMLVNRFKEQYPELHCFFFEKEQSYFDEDEAFDYFYSIATEEEGLEGDEAWKYADDMLQDELRYRNDLGFDY